MKNENLIKISRREFISHMFVMCMYFHFQALSLLNFEQSKSERDLEVRNITFLKIRSLKITIFNIKNKVLKCPCPSVVELGSFLTNVNGFHDITILFNFDLFLFWHCYFFIFNSRLISFFWCLVSKCRGKCRIPLTISCFLAIVLWLF